MQLKSLEISGFKSFAKKANLIFNSSITGIVGPNGSGKSNVAESFRFVLGEQSLKSMRGKKGEDLIFNGGKDQPRANRASVKLVFDNSKRFFNVDFDEVSIERVVHRDGVNEYLLNGSPVRLKDITELLAHANIGASGHHIISQGEADRLLSAQPVERREMIEDALGLKLFQYRKEDSEKKLEKTGQHIKEVESLRREIAPHIKFLKKQVEKIEKARELRTELSHLYQEYFVREEHYLKVEKAKITHERQEPETALKDLTEQLAHHRKIVDESKKSDTKSSELLTLESAIAHSRSRKDQLTREIGRLEGELSYIKRAIEKKLQAAQSVEGKTILLKDVETVANSLEAIAQSAEGLVDISQIKAKIGEIRHILKEFISEKKAVDPILVKQEEDELKTIEANILKHDAELKQISEAETSHRSEYEKIKQQIEEDKDKNVESEKAILLIMSKQSEIHSVLHDIRGREERLKMEQSEFERELHDASALVGREALQYDVQKHTSSIDAGLLPKEERHVQVDRRRSIERIKIRLEEMGGGGGEDVMKEFTEAEERDLFLARELEDLMKSSESLAALIKDLTGKLNEMFKEGLEKINTEFTKFFALMFGGGHAQLKLIKEEKKKRRRAGEDGEGAEELLVLGGEEESEVQEGIDIEVSLPHKRIKGLMMLSGGERALTSIALLFAMSQVNPPPFVILDETDAALDEANSRKYGDMIEALSKHSQLILITHNRETMSRAGVIYGVTMGGDGCSKLLSIAFEEAVAVAK